MAFPFQQPDPEWNEETTSFEIDTESPEWFRLEPDCEPDRLTYWDKPVFGNAQIANAEDIRSLLQRPDEDHPCRLPDVSFILQNETIYKQNMYLSSALRNQNIVVSSTTGGGKTQRYILPLLCNDVVQ